MGHLTEKEKFELLPGDVDGIESELSRFADPDFPGHQTSFDRWFGCILEKLSEGNFHPYLRPVHVTRKEITEAFKERISGILTEHIAEFDEDPKSYLEFHKNDPRGNHPCGNEVVDRCYKFLETATPYSVWKFYRQVKNAVAEAVEENLVTMAFQEGLGSNLDEVAENAMLKALDKLRNELD
ncbi:MAG: hypothetical protein WC824_08125 [Bacteroidota bacterium]|jgi:hypothetical protein